MQTSPSLSLPVYRAVSTPAFAIPLVLGLLSLVGWAFLEGSPSPLLHPAAVPSSALQSGSGSTKKERFSLLLRRQKRMDARGIAEYVPYVPPAPPKKPNQRGVYLTSGSVGREQFFNETLDTLLKVKGSALVFDAKGSFVYFHSTSPYAVEKNFVRPLYDLPAILQKAREKNIYTIARFISLKDYTLSSAVSASQICHPVSKRCLGVGWVDGSKPDTLEYNRQVIHDLAMAGVDEINLDYIRYPTEYAQSQIGLTGAQKSEHIEAFLRMARAEIDAVGKGTKLGISTYAILGWNFPVNFEPLGQDIGKFANIVDVVSPMAYPATFAEGHYYIPGKNPRSRMYYLVYRTLTGYKELMGDNAWKIRPWIQGYSVSSTDVREQIDAVFDAGACGFTFWNAGNNYGSVYAAMPNIVVPAECQ